MVFCTSFKIISVISRRQPTYTCTCISSARLEITPFGKTRVMQIRNRPSYDEWRSLVTTRPIPYLIAPITENLKSFLHIYSFELIEEKRFRKRLWKNVKLLKMSNFTFFHNVFYAICI